MYLTDLEQYNPITIQCHDNPDADAIGAGFCLYQYFRRLQGKVRLIYSGRSEIVKTSLRLMVDALHIPLEYVPVEECRHLEGLLLTVDCQYGAGNVTKIEADRVASIDHHPMEIYDIALSRMEPGLGSCCTLVWNMLKEAGFETDGDEVMGTALYYGLYMDTNQFAELSNPLDMDMCESVTVNKGLLVKLRNANISLRELEIAGIAMLRHDYNEDYRFAVIKAHPCDPNLLGLISDFLLQVAEVDTCVVFNENEEGFKLSVRSCVREVNANELAAFLTDGMGSGGGHFEKAGGFIGKNLYEKRYPTLHVEAYVNNRMVEYFDSFQIIYAREESVKVEDFVLYARRKELLCYLELDGLFEAGTPISLRSCQGSVEYVVEKDSYMILERDGSAHIMCRELFERYMETSTEAVPEDYCERKEYEPVIKNQADGRAFVLLEHCRLAVPGEAFRIYARRLDKNVKLFSCCSADRYLLGRQGDFLAVSENDLHHMYIEKKEYFEQKFRAI